MSAEVMPLADILAEARRILEAGQHIPLRLVGGLAVAVVTPGTRLLERVYKDIDLVAARGQRSSIIDLFGSLGYDADETFNALHGSRRLLFYDAIHGRQVDIFVGRFEMCHSLPIADRLKIRQDTLPIADLLLTKLQIVSLNDKDQRDVFNLLFHLPLTNSDSLGINANYIAVLCAADWGLWRTVTMNLERVRGGVAQYGLTGEQRDVLTTQIDDLVHAIAGAPKSTRWKLRARVGERVRWYDEPEEVR